MTGSIYIYALLALLAFAAVTWLLSVFKRDVSIVDSIWSLLILTAASVYLWHNEAVGFREILILLLVLIWALRLSIYLTWRNWGQPEDYRYQQIRAKYSPHFAFKSLLIIFVFQALLAWLISLPLVITLSDSASFSFVDVAAILLWLVGMSFETVADFQLHRFKVVPANKGKVLDTGLWRYSRHPNYFGEFCIWWGFYLFAVSTGGWWTIISPLMMSFLLLRFSGVALLEKDIHERRPAYRAYITRTNAFLPGKPRKPVVTTAKETAV
jgi:steroid 5-alpha reductase family enzyme